jgi:hypothetical protein
MWERRLIVNECGGGFQSRVEVASVVQYFPVAGGGNDVAKNLERALHGAEPMAVSEVWSDRNDIGNVLTEAGDAKGLLGLVSFFQKRYAIGLEFGDGDFFHNRISD